ncbi:MAG: response regulator [Actinomycetes bacterium]
MEEQLPNGRIRVVVVDDHRLVAEGLTATLEAAGDMEVVGISGTAAQGVDMVRAYRPDVVLLDQRLPDNDGTTVIGPMLNVSPTSKVVMLTATDDDSVLLRAIEAGCAGFVTKGRTSATLVEAVRAAASGEAVIAPDALARLLPRLSDRRARLGSDLSPREREVLALLVAGLPNADIAKNLSISYATARNHVQAIISKLGAHSKLEAVAIALREGVVEPPR